MNTVQSRDSINAEVKQAFGLVPEFIKSVPDAALPGFWAQMRDFHLAETAIPNKYKELIGIAVSGATRCRYCTLFHTEAARLHGATDAEIREASLMAGWTMQTSTYMNSIQLDYDNFKVEMGKVVKHIRANAAVTPQSQRPHERV